MERPRSDRVGLPCYAVGFTAEYAMYELKDLLQRGGDLYAPNTRRPVALSAGDVPDLPTDWSNSGPFTSYERNVYNSARNVVMWWTPARVEHEALRMAGDVEGPSILSQEAYVFRAIYMQIALLIAEWMHVQHARAVYNPPEHVESRQAAIVARQTEMFRDLVHEAVLTLERKAQQVEARAMDLRMRYDAQKLRTMLVGLDVSTKLGQLIEEAQRENEAQSHMLKLLADLREPVEQGARALGSVSLVVDACWDRTLHNDAEARRLKTTLAKMGDKATDAALKAFFTALGHKIGL